MPEAAQPTLAEFETDRTEAREEVRRATARARALEKTNSELRTELKTIKGTQRLAHEIAVPRWAKPPRTKRADHHATPTLLLTDLHFGEVVRAEEVLGYNEFDLDIAERRLSRVVDSTVEILKKYVAGVTFDGIVVQLNGDFVTGWIHDELSETNAETVPETVVRLVPLLASALRYLADAYGNVYCPSVAGNHDRLYHKPRHKKRAQNSWTWLIYSTLKMVLADDDRITIDIAEGASLPYQVYGTRFVAEHGDNYHGGSGIAGIMSPLMLGQHRKQRVHNIIGIPYDTLVLGHFHQTLYMPGVFVGGSLKGLDEYASNSNFAPEPPRQSLWLTTPERGVTIQTYVDAEPAGWRP